MNAFLRALRLALRHRFTFVMSIVCALGVAAFWGANIATLYPCVGAILHAESLPTWIDGKIRVAEQKRGEALQKQEELERELATLGPDERSPVERQIRIQQDRVTAEDAFLVRARWFQPHLHRWMPEDPFDTLLLIIGVLVFGTIMKVLLLFAGQLLVARLAESAALDLRQQFYGRMLDIDLAAANQLGQGDLMNRFTANITAVSLGIRLLLGKAIREPLKMIVCLIGAALVCWRLLILTLIVVPLAGYLISRLAKSLKRANRRAMQEMSNVYGSISETLRGLRVVKAFTMEQVEQKRFQTTANEYFRKAMRIARYDALISPLNELTAIAIISVAILVAAYLSLNWETHLFGLRLADRRIGTEECLLFFGFLAGMTDPARKLSDIFGRLQQAGAASDRVFEILDRTNVVNDAANPQPIAGDRLLGTVTFENVCFAYDEGHPILRDINLEIEGGETVAIVGPNGCGKSTLTSLLPRFFDPTAGRVAIGGQNVADLYLRELRGQMGLVSQETLLFDRSVTDNIRFGSPDATDEEVVRAARQAHADTFITDKLPAGYDTIVGPGGNRLSGGQRQRIALARAILRNPAILILDEATSQIDLESERLIHQTLEAFTRDRTTLIITHRLSTLKLAARVIVMDHGRIRSVGTHDQLLGTCDFYRRLHQVDLRQTA